MGWDGGGGGGRWGGGGRLRGAGGTNVLHSLSLLAHPRLVLSMPLPAIVPPTQLGHLWHYMASPSATCSDEMQAFAEIRW